MPITFVMVVCFIENNPLSSFLCFLSSASEGQHRATPPATPNHKPCIFCKPPCTSSIPIIPMCFVYSLLYTPFLDLSILFPVFSQTIIIPMDLLGYLAKLHKKSVLFIRFRNFYTIIYRHEKAPILKKNEGFSGKILLFSLIGSSDTSIPVQLLRFSDRFGCHLHLYNAYKSVTSHGQRQGCEHHNRRTILYRATVP